MGEEPEIELIPPSVTHAVVLRRLLASSTHPRELTLPVFHRNLTLVIAGVVDTTSVPVPGPLDARRRAILNSEIIPEHRFGARVLGPDGAVEFVPVALDTMWYYGHIRGEEETSSVRISIGKVTTAIAAFIASADGFYYTITPSRSRQDTTTINSGEGREHSQENLVSENGKVPDPTLTSSSVVSLEISRQRSAFTPEELATIQRLHQVHCAQNTTRAATGPDRRRRSGPLSPQHTACTVYLDADDRYYVQWGGIGTVVERTQRVVARMINALVVADSVRPQIR